jgi:hypothetical protein
MKFFLSILASVFMAIAVLGKTANASNCGSCVCDQGEHHDSLKGEQLKGSQKNRKFQEDVTETDIFKNSINTSVHMLIGI